MLSCVPLLLRARQISEMSMPASLREGRSHSSDSNGEVPDHGAATLSRPPSPSLRAPRRLAADALALAEQQQMLHVATSPEAQHKASAAGGMNAAAAPPAPSISTNAIGGGGGGRQRPYRVAASITGGSRVSPPYCSPPSLFPACYHATSEGTAFSATVRCAGVRRSCLLCVTYSGALR